jgi:hypothetical protein
MLCNFAKYSTSSASNFTHFFTNFPLSESLLVISSSKDFCNQPLNKLQTVKKQLRNLNSIWKPVNILQSLNLFPKSRQHIQNNVFLIWNLKSLIFLDKNLILSLHFFEVVLRHSISSSSSWLITPLVTWNRW